MLGIAPARPIVRINSRIHMHRGPVGRLGREGTQVTIKADAGGGHGSGGGDSAGRRRYKWVALTNTTMGALLVTIDASIMIIAMPDIFRGIRLDPLVPGNNTYLLWMILGYLVTSSVLVVSVGRLGDLFGRVRMYNLGFVIYTVASLMLTIELADRPVWRGIRLLLFRIVQGIGGAFLLGNSGAILTDAFPARQRGLALGINNIAGISGSFIGLILGGILAPINWRLVFLISVPFGIFGTVWAYVRLRDLSGAVARAGRLAGQRHTFAAPGIILDHGGRDRPACSRTTGTRWAGAARVSSPSSRRAWLCWLASCSSRRGWPTRCSGSACLRSGRSPSVRSPRSCPRSAAVA